MKTPWISFLLVGLGGFLGAILRFSATNWIHRAIPGGTAFPLGTLLVNLLGCLLFGVLAGVAEQHRVLTPEHRLFLLVGILGSFTTFSTFAFDTMMLAEGAALARAVLNVALHVIIGCLALWFGLAAVRFFA